MSTPVDHSDYGAQRHSDVTIRRRLIHGVTVRHDLKAHTDIDQELA
jgi:hypothetical protein